MHPNERTREVEALVDAGQIERSALLVLRLACDSGHHTLIKEAQFIVRAVEADKGGRTQLSNAARIRALAIRVAAASSTSTGLTGRVVLSCRGLGKHRRLSRPPFRLQDIDLDLRIGEIRG